MRYKSILVCGLAAILLTGCGGLDSTDRQTGSAKPDAVSAGAVSETAVKQEKNDTKETGKGFTIKSCNANSTNLYESTGEEYSNVIVQCQLDGTKIRNLEVERKGADIISVRYVDDEWLYYTRWEKNSGDTRLWRAPIQKKDGCDDIIFENEEFLFLSESGIFDVIYVIGDYVYYNESGGGAKASTYCKYDMKKKAWVTFAEGSPEQNAANGARWVGAVGENMILFCDEELATKGNEGIYVQPVLSNKFQKIQELGGDDNVAYMVSNYYCSQEAFFFVCDTHWDIQEDDKTAVKIWKPGMEKALTYVSDKDIKKELEKSTSHSKKKKIALEDITYCEWDIWLDESHLYIHLSDIGEEDGEEEVWFACDGIDKYSLEVLDQAPAIFADEDE